MKEHTVYPVTANNAINIDPPQMDIGQYVHVYHYLTKEDVIMVDDHVRVKELETNVPTFWKEYSLREQMLSYIAFSRWLESDDKPDAVLILHENNFWTKPLSFLCQQKGIPCFAFQEGLLRLRDQETMRKQSFACEYSTKLFVWGESSKRQYIDAGVDGERIVIAGASHLFTSKQRSTNEKGKVVYFLPLLQHYKGNPQNDIEAISAYCRSAGLNFVVRLHPFEQDIDIPFAFDNRENVAELIIEADVALVQHSTTALECLALGTPIVEVNFSGQPMIEPLHKENQDITFIGSYKELAAIGDVLDNPKIDQSWVKQHIQWTGPSSLATIGDEIEKWLQ